MVHHPYGAGGSPRAVHDRLEISKHSVGLGNVDNTADLEKPISTATQEALDLKLNNADGGAFGLSLLATPDIASAKILLAYVKADIGLDNVDNTTDLNKPISTATQTALDLKLDDSQATATGLALLGAANAEAAQTILGLENVDNTSDLNKPVSTATQTALDLKLDDSQAAAFGLTLLATADVAAAKAALAYVKADVGLGNVDNTSDANKPISTATQTALDLKLDDAQAAAFGLTLLGTVDVAGAKIALAYTKADIGLGNVDNTSDANKPVSTATQTALDLKLDDSQAAAFGLTLLGCIDVAAAKTALALVKADVGLANVDNTSDANKPVSTAQQTALDQKIRTIKSAVAVSHTGSVAEVQLAAIVIPAGSMGPNGRIELELHYSFTGSANVKTMRARWAAIGGTAFLSQSASGATLVQARYNPFIANRNANNIQQLHGGSFIGTSAAALIADGAIDTTVAQTIYITGQLATAGETIKLESYIAKIYYGA
jgi:hypothetical protein